MNCGAGESIPHPFCGRLVSAISGDASPSTPGARSMTAGGAGSRSAGSPAAADAAPVHRGENTRIGEGNWGGVRHGNAVRIPVGGRKDEIPKRRDIGRNGHLGPEFHLCCGPFSNSRRTPSSNYSQYKSTSAFCHKQMAGKPSPRKSGS